MAFGDSNVTMPIPAQGLGRLEKVKLRDVWVSEPGEFTPWLAQLENIAMLGDAIGMELEVEAQERGVGPFRADILCKDTASGNWVLIENQLERTDHAHLGQLLTYAAGLHAVTIVWIAERFTDEHRAALDWLNEATNESINFFGLEIELWRIGTSPVAPKFNIVSKPNDWTSSVSGVVANVELGDAKKLQLAFWSCFREYVETHGATFKPTKPLPQHWMAISIGRSGFKLTAIASFWDSELESGDKHEVRAEVEIFDNNAKVYYAQLLAMKEQIESELGESLTWYNPENKRVCRMYFRKTVDLYARDRWLEYAEWLKVKIESLKKVFAWRIKELDAEFQPQVDGIAP
jgi:hypothetical protein